MKTAISPKAQSLRPVSGVHGSLARRTGARSFVATMIAALATFGIGVSSPMLSNAQEPARTIATGTGIPLSADAPDRYTVKKGDTLWDIAKVFLRDPWYWPEIWYVNPQIKNPHLIYPGDVLALVSIEGRPQVSVAERGPEGAAAEAGEPVAEADAAPTRSGSGVRLSPRVRSQPITAAVTAIPYEAVANFMSKPTLLTKAQVKSGPYIVGMRDDHMIGGASNEFYVRGIADAAEGARYNIIHVGDPLRDPENNKVLGYRGDYVGAGAISLPGKVAKLRAESSHREALRGDKLFAEDIAIPLDFIPHPAPENVKGSIAAVVDGVTISGRYNVVALNRGTKQGLEPGHVLAIKQKGGRVRDHYSNGGQDNYWSFGRNVRLPDEHIGVVMVFKAYERMSYGLIMEATHPVRIGDLIAAP